MTNIRKFFFLNKKCLLRQISKADLYDQRSYLHFTFHIFHTDHKPKFTYGL